MLSRPMLDALRAMAAAHDVTLFMLLHASFALLVGRYSGASDVVLGTTQANRGAPDVEGVVGLFMNPVALRVDLGGAPTFSELLARARGMRWRRSIIRRRRSISCSTRSPSNAPWRMPRWCR